MTIDEYLDTAREKNGIASDNKLGLALGISGASVNQFRTKRSWPSDETMIALAELANVDPQAALLDLDYWRAKSPRVANIRALMRERIAQVAGVAFAFVIAASAASNDASAARTYAQQTRAESGNLYIMWSNYRVRTMPS